MYFEDAYLLNNPAHKAKGAEEMAPWTVYEETGNEDRSDKYPTIDRDNGGFINFKRIHSADNVETPGKGNNSKNRRMWRYEWCWLRQKEALPERNMPVLSFSLRFKSENGILEGAELASPGTDEFVGEKNRNEEDCESNHAGREDDPFRPQKNNRILHSTHGTWV